ncbi:MAG: hypothetical protein PHP54_02000 [Clostridia bacterium]|nr:hypothetical protein [Clostridia bacterium]
MRKEKKLQNYLFLGIILIVIVSIISIFAIWGNNDKVDTSIVGLASYSVSDFKAKTYDIYSSEVKRLLMPQNTDQLFDKMESTFLASNSLNKGNFKKYLEDNKLIGKDIRFSGYTVIQNNDTYIYRIQYSLYENDKSITTKIINVIEDKPYSYRLSFDQESISLLKNLKLIRSYNDIKFDISCISSNTESIKFKIIIENNNKEDVKIDFDSVNNVVLVLNDNRMIKMAATVISSDEEILTNGSTITKEAYFAIGLEDQGKIKAINFGNVKIGNENKVITLNF